MSRLKIDSHSPTSIEMRMNSLENKTITSMIFRNIDDMHEELHRNFREIYKCLGIDYDDVIRFSQNVPTDYDDIFRLPQNRSVNDDLNRGGKPFTKTERKWIERKIKKSINQKKSKKERKIQNKILKSMGLRMVKNFMDIIQSIF